MNLEAAVLFLLIGATTWASMVVAIVGCLGREFFVEVVDDEGWTGLGLVILEIALWPVTLWRVDFPEDER